MRGRPVRGRRSGCRTARRVAARLEQVDGRAHGPVVLAPDAPQGELLVPGMGGSTRERGGGSGRDVRGAVAVEELVEASPWHSEGAADLDAGKPARPWVVRHWRAAALRLILRMAAASSIVKTSVGGAGSSPRFRLGLDHRVAAHPRRRRPAVLPPRPSPRHDSPLNLVHVRQDHPEKPREHLRGDLHAAMIYARANLSWTLVRSGQRCTTHCTPGSPPAAPRTPGAKPTTMGAGPRLVAGHHPLGNRARNFIGPHAAGSPSRLGPRHGGRRDALASWRRGRP